MLENWKALLEASGLKVEDVRRAFKAGTTIEIASGLYGTSLEPLVRMLIPTLDGWVRRVPRKNLETGLTQTFKKITGVTLQGKGTVANGTRGNSASITTGSKTIHLGNLTSGVFSTDLQTEKTGGTYEDIVARLQVLKLMNALRTENNHILGGNVYALAVPAVTVAENTSVAGVLDHAATYYIYVRALTANAANKALLGQLYPIPGPTKSSTYYTIDPSKICGGSPSADLLDGYSAPSTVDALATPVATSSIDISWSPIPGAVAYAIFIGTTTGITNAALQCVTAQCNVTLLNVSTGGTKASATTTYYDGYGVAQTADATGDTSADTNDYEGILSSLYGLDGAGTCTPSGCYLKHLGAQLSTAAGTGIAEIDEMLVSQFYNMLLNDDVTILCGGLTRKSINRSFGTATTGATLNLVAPNTNGAQNSVAGLYVVKYIHPVTQRLINIETDPGLADGIILSMPNSVPYADSGITDLLTLWDLYDWLALDYAMTRPKKEGELQKRGGLMNYAPTAWGIIDNIYAG